MLKFLLRFRKRRRPVVVPRFVRFIVYVVLLTVAVQRVKQERDAHLRRYEERLRKNRARRRQSFP
ncbi:protein US34A [Human betaherpesvirus 5]|uniref:Protein US34A n=1 Tax=Human cytomegalovirus TaxID=10359 RepID=D2K4T6_HCMV|nr:protein US34A [Human betaherpesvirus 5]